MNQSNLYSYSILSGVWNDLSLDVLLLVKEYLRIHLDRILLNKDYKMFLEATNEKIKHLPDRKVIISSIRKGSMDIRYGLRFDPRKTYYSINGSELLYPIDFFIKDKYYILGVNIRIYDNGINIHFRRCFVVDYLKRKFPKTKQTDIELLINNEIKLNSYIRFLMDTENINTNQT